MRREMDAEARGGDARARSSASASSYGTHATGRTMMMMPPTTTRAMASDGVATRETGRTGGGVDVARDAERAALMPWRGDRASGGGEGDEFEDAGDESTRGRGGATRGAGAWRAARAVALVACAFAVGVATGTTSSRTMAARDLAEARVEAAVAHARREATPALGLSQYERDRIRGERAMSRALRRAPRHPPSLGALANKTAAPLPQKRNATAVVLPRGVKDAMKESAASIDLHEEDDATYDELLAQEPPERPIIKGVKVNLEKTREELIESENEDENSLGYYRFPTSANGKLAFVSESNIWITSVQGGTASRLSSTYSREGIPVLSPKGDYVAFLALTYDGYDVFVTPTRGGVAEQITFGGEAQDLAGWPAENELLIISTGFSRTNNPQLVRVNPDTKESAPLPFDRAIEATKDGMGCYVFVPLRQTSATKRYEGGEQSRLWRWCKKDREASELTPQDGWGLRGAWSPSVSRLPSLKDYVFFISDKTGVANLWSMKTDGSAQTQLTNECLFDIKEFTIDQEAITYRRGGGLYHRRILFADGVLTLRKEVPLNFELVSEFRKTMPAEIQDPYASISEFVLTSDGAFAGFVIRGQIYYSALVPFLGARVEKVSAYNGAVRYKHIQFVRDSSQDGQPKLLALSDASGEYEYVLFERQREGGHWKETQITTGGKIKGAMEYSSISPDNSALLLADTNGNMKLVNLTETAVNTNKYRTTIPTQVSAKLAKRDGKIQAKGVAKGARKFETMNDEAPKLGVDDALSGERRAERRRQARAAARKAARVEHRRSFRHLASIGLRQEKAGKGPTVAHINGLAEVDTMLTGFRPEGVYDFSWSPDSNFVAFAKDEENDFTSINVLNITSGETLRITTPSYNAHSPKFSPDGLYLYYLSDQRIASSANSPYGSRGAEPTFDETSRLMCVPLRSGMTCPFFIGDELNAEGSVFDAQFGKALPTVISMHRIEQRAQLVPELPDAHYIGFDLIGDGSGVLFKIIDDDQVVVAAYSMYTRTIVPLYPDPMGVVVSGDMQIFTLITEQGVALLSSKSVLQPGIGQEQALSGAEVWKLPDAFSVTVNPREEWLQMYEEAMRNMRDAFYDPNLHGVDWKSVTDRYRPLVYKISSKSELRDILSQAFGELSALHVFVQVKAEDPVLPLGTPSACLGADFKTVSAGLKISYIHDSSGILDAPNSALSQTTSSSHVHLLPGDVITKIDGVLVNSTSLPLSQLLRGKAGMQVLLEVVKAPRSPEERRDEEDLQKLKELRQMQQMMSGGFGMSKASLGTVNANDAMQSKPILDRHVAKLVRKHSKKISPLDGDDDDNDAVGALDAEVVDLGMASGTVGAGLAKAMLKDLKPEKKTTELIVVTPLTLKECEMLQAADVVVQRREYVKNRTDDKVAYVYLEDMEQMGKGSSNSFDDFAAQFYPNVRKSGLIIDVRKNAGGNIDTWLLERLRRVAWMFDTERSGPGDTTMQYTFRGKVVVLIDEQTSSDAEMFALGIQQLGIGPVIGERTWGGAIGYSGHPELRLVDGSGFTIPSYGPYLKDDWAIEQKGVTPDVRVSNLPVSTFRGSDAQLDAGINRVLHMIENAEQTEFDLPTAPKYPNRAFDSASCAARKSTPKPKDSRG